MALIVLLVLGGVAVYVMKPDERKRVAARVLRPVENFWFAVQDDRAKPDPFRDALRERTKWPVVTWAIVVVNVLVFLAIGTGHGDPAALVGWGASVAPTTTSGEWWRLVTASFVQAGFFALLVNMIGLLQPAMLLEQMLGHAALAAVFLAGGMIGTLADLSTHPLVVSAGTSGGVLAVYGMLGAAIIRGIVQRSPWTIPVKTLRLLAPAAGVFLLRALVIGDLMSASGVIPLGLGFVFGFVLGRHVTESPARIDRVAIVSAATLIIAAGVAWPLRGIVDARPEIARLLATEDQTSGEYTKAIGQFKLGAMKAEAVAQLIDRRIDPALTESKTRLAALGAVPREQRPLVAAADDYVALRRECWQLRSKGLHKASMRMLRDADEKERAALAALEKLRTQG